MAVADEEEGVAVLDRVRPWLSVLLALSANSPFWQGADTTYESYRGSVWARWPTAGPAPLFGSPAAYHRLVAAMVATGSVLDDGMVYWEARLGRGYPTVEIRSADVCLDVRDAARCLRRCAGRWSRLPRTNGGTVTRARGLPGPSAARGVAGGAVGTTGRLVHPLRLVPVDAWSAVAALQEHVAAALDGSGDADAVLERLAGIRAGGTGAAVQRRAYATRGDLRDVVRDAVARTNS